MNNFKKKNILSTLFILFISLSFNHTSQACNIEPIVPAIKKQTLLKAKGGPRNVIQERSSIIVIQPSNEYLALEIFNEKGKLVYQGTTTTRKTFISLAKIEADKLTVITVDSYNDTQVFHIKMDKE